MHKAEGFLKFGKQRNDGNKRALLAWRWRCTAQRSTLPRRFPPNQGRGNGLTGRALALTDSLALPLQKACFGKARGSRRGYGVEENQRVFILGKVSFKAWFSPATLEPRDARAQPAAS